jgi:peptidoglycan/xylan/chitin deacetylase (PgdA/CDA1 family)
MTDRKPATVCLSLDLEPDHAGRAPVAYDGWEPSRIDALLGLLRDHGAPLTVFVVADSLAARPEAIRRFLDAGAEFHLHSYSHDMRHPDSTEQIEKGRAAFAAHFGRPPEGYRAPEGRISPAGWERLDAAGFLFDSSIFPSFWPRLRYLRYRPAPFRPAGRRLLELPISTVTPLRLIVALSWMKLLGWSVYRPLLERRRLPEPLVFDMHLHDLWRLPAFEHLSGPWRAVYGRGRREGFLILESFLELLRRRGSRFTTLGSVARQGLAAAC